MKRTDLGVRIETFTVPKKYPWDEFGACCGELFNAVKPNVFTNYVQLVQERHGEPDWWDASRHSRLHGILVLKSCDRG